MPRWHIQHQVHHPDGILCLDRMEDHLSLTFLDEYARYWAPCDEENEADG